ncbi:translation initiation factor 2 [uncultured Roseovarius sp.]|uniref:translation initiation factor 2 n=1 Tax=uncultured Roseovarius sp. TaxID=293344 RepID=UPI002614FE7A|nr:translation initiation factor 2 [uncultured Roseovarius sp.]
MKIILPLALTGLVLSGCATVTRGKNEDVMFTSMPAGAHVTTTNGYNCTTPCALKMKRKDKFVATFERDGKTRQVHVKTIVADGGGAALVGNVLAGGVIGIGVDAASGASLNHTPNPVHVDFTRPAPVAKPAEEDAGTS